VPGNGDMLPPPVPASKFTEVLKTPAKDIAVLKDGDEVVVPSTPRFTPFRDEVSRPWASLVRSDSVQAMVTGITSPASTSASIPDTVMKIKVVGDKVSGTTEAEALRKDPLKNYCHQKRSA
jgi:hypothetical protein